MIFVFLVAMLPRMLLWGSNYWTSPDALEYMNVGKNLANGLGLIKSVKIHYFDLGPVVRPAVGTKPVLFSVFLGGTYSLNHDWYWSQLVNLILGGVAVVFFYLWVRERWNEKIALWSGLLWGLNPDFLINNRLLLSEELYLALIFLGLYWLEKKKNMGAGIAAGMAYLTRTEGVLVAAYMVLKGWGKKKLWLIIGLGVAVIPFLLANKMETGSFFTSVGKWHFVTLNFLDSVTNHFGEKNLSLFEFVSRNFWGVVDKVWFNLVECVKMLIRPTGLGLLWLGVMGIRKKDSDLVLLALANLGLVIVTWGVILDPSRYMELVVAIAIPVLVAGMSRWKWKRWLLVGALAIFVFFDAKRIGWAKNDFDTNWKGRDVNQALELIKNKTSKNDLIGGENPGLINIKIDRSATIVPYNLDDEKLARFVSIYPIKAIIMADKESMTVDTLSNNDEWEERQIGRYLIYIKNQ